VARSPGRGRDRDDRDNEFTDKLVHINRVAKTVKGGKRFGFAALVIVGDLKGRVGFGHGKAREVPEAIRKANESARRALVRVHLREGRTLDHDTFGRHGAGKVLIRSAPPGTGIIAGGAMRAVFEMLGVQDVVAKSMGSANPYNVVRATFDALAHQESPRAVAARRGKKPAEINARRRDGASVAENTTKEPEAEQAAAEEAPAEGVAAGLTQGEGAPAEAEEQQPVVAPTIRGKIDRFGVAMGTGRRKTSVARVRIKEGSGTFTVNGKPMTEYFCVERDQKMVEAPLAEVDKLGKVDVWVRVNGGGTTGQTGAVVLGIARALQAIDPAFHTSLSTGGFLTRDSRMVERKKFGLKKARKSFQFSKR